MVLVVIIIAIGISIFFGIHSRVKTEHALKKNVDQTATATVTTTHPVAGAPNDMLVLPGNTLAFSDTAIFARTNGYLTHWYFDIGAHVKRGQLLAEIAAPEIDDQLRQALADLTTAQANLKLASITAERNESLLKTRSVSTQERDNAVGALDSDKAIVQSRQATVSQLTQLQSYQKIYAPFDGIVTARNIDIGALINSGAAQGQELFHMVATDILRIYVAIPEPYAPSIHSGAKATITLDEFPNQTFDGTLVRNSNAIDPISRTLLVEVDVDNAKGQLLPGSYVFVHFSLPGKSNSVTIPANALLFRKEGLQVGVVHDGNKVDLVGIKIGRDYGDNVEVVSGLQASDEIIVNPSDSLLSGAHVNIAPPKPPDGKPDTTPQEKAQK